ncbi:hypothetical protein [Microbacterium jiangjiandongii]|uniref:hypothetical protein n=1 Tax=Microbacterium jiangjiandongii TaxID=3049071 RepID=UPI00214C3762|nr:hypothetical protein [Microbacterium sp. zg.Y843]MCR2815141.1 hypothetical protein [Microbacterium sp. zg.Y843]
MRSIRGDDYPRRDVAGPTAAVRPAERVDYAAELRASIRDQIDGRVAQGEEPAAAEVAVLNGLGDPAVLAAGYADRPLYLIGPRWYPTWRRILRIVLWSALPPVAFGVVVALVLADRSPWGIIGPTIGITLSVGAVIFTGMTIVYTALERTGEPVGAWTVDQLPSGEMDAGTRLGPVEMTLHLVAVVFAIVGLVAVTVPWSIDDAGHLSVLDAALWPGSLIVGILLVLVGAVVTLRARATDLWGGGSATAVAVLALAWAAPVVGLAVTGRLFDPAFVAYLDIDGDAQRVITLLVVVGTLAITGWSAFAAFRRALRTTGVDADPRGIHPS